MSWIMSNKYYLHYRSCKSQYDYNVGDHTQLQSLLLPFRQFLRMCRLFLWFYQHSKLLWHLLLQILWSCIDDATVFPTRPHFNNYDINKWLQGVLYVEECPCYVAIAQFDVWDLNALGSCPEWSWPFDQDKTLRIRSPHFQKSAPIQTMP